MQLARYAFNLGIHQIGFANNIYAFMSSNSKVRSLTKIKYLLSILLLVKTSPIYQSVTFRPFINYANSTLDAIVNCYFLKIGDQKLKKFNIYIQYHQIIIIAAFIGFVNLHFLLYVLKETD